MLKNNEKFFNLPKVLRSHPVANTYLLFAYPFNWIYDRIPGFRNLNVTAETIQNGLAFWAIQLWLVLLLVFCWAFVVMAGNSPYHTIIASLQLGMYLAAVMLLLPRMTSIMMEGLVPLSNVARKTGQTFPGSSNHCWNGHCPDCGSSVGYRPGIITDPGDCDPRSDLARQPRYATG